MSRVARPDCTEYGFSKKKKLENLGTGKHFICVFVFLHIKTEKVSHDAAQILVKAQNQR
ncbi:MAG: hypothetical protein AB2693_32920 [Candidatus Thiodiazotropha sp.]